jgi:cobalt/nickel transport system permease protein
MVCVPLFAVHIADGILPLPWCIVGLALLMLSVGWAMHKLDERTVPRIGVATGLFFVASQVHLQFGPVSVHLLLNGVVGALLGRRAPLAIAVGLAMQAYLFGHGGYWALGMNFVVLCLPALGCGALIRLGLHRGYRPLLVGTLGGACGAFSTIVLHAVVLRFGAGSDFTTIAWVSVFSHLPVIVVESLMVGWLLRVVVHAKPEWLNMPGHALHTETESVTSHEKPVQTIAAVSPAE